MKQHKSGKKLAAVITVVNAMSTKWECTNTTHIQSAVYVCPTMLYVTKVITFLRRILRAHALSRNNTSFAPICFMHFPYYMLYICIAIEQAPQLMICLQSEVRFVSAWQPQRLNSKHWFHFFYFIHTNITSYLNSLFEFIFTFHQLWFARLRCAHHLYFYFPPCSILFRKGYLEG